MESLNRAIHILITYQKGGGTEETLSSNMNHGSLAVG